MKNLLKKTSKIFILILLILALLITAGIIAGNIFKDEIRNYIISEINREIEVKVSVNSADFSVFRKFPFVSIVLTDVVVLSGKELARSQFLDFSADTLFTSSRIYLQFNLFDILHKDYRLRRVHALNGMVSILVDKSGKVNYSIFKKNTGTRQNNFTLGLDAVKISGFSWRYLNLANKMHSEGHIKDISLKGKFSQNNFSLNSISSIFINSFNREGIEYASKLEIISRLILNVNDSVYKVIKGELTLNNLKFNAGGSFTNGLKTNVDIQVSGVNLDINTLISILPFNAKAIEKYIPGGKAEILAKIKGELSSITVPSVRAAFKVSDGKLFIPAQNNYISGIALNGTYSNGSLHNASTSRIILKEYSLNYGKSHLIGKLTINNFISPFLSATLSGNIIASDLSDILNMDNLKLEQGFLYPDLSVNLNLDSFNSFKLQNIGTEGLTGKLEFKGISGKLPYIAIPVNQLDGIIRVDGDTWFPELKMELGRNKFALNLVVNYLWEYFVNKSVIPEIKGEILSEYFSLSDFLSKSDTDNHTDFYLPDSIILNLHCIADSFIYGKFYASDLETWFNYKPGLLSVSILKMQTMKGRISTAGAIIADNQGQMLLHASGELRNIDIHKLFLTFNNFGQNFIVADNLKGSATGKIDFSASISPKLELQTKNLTAQSDFIIEEGELINFEPVTELSSFVELSELQHIKFSTLKNSVLIKDEKVFIPQMEIKSSAFNLSVSGIHGFDNHFEYKLRLNLSEILAGKARKAKKENEEFGIIEEGEAGNTNLYISITGTPDNYKIKYDKREALIKIKDDLKEEKKLLKTILREELGIFKKDSVNINNKNNNFDQKKFIMDWEDETISPEKPGGNPKEKKIRKKDPDINITWEEDNPVIKK